MTQTQHGPRAGAASLAADFAVVLVILLAPFFKFVAFRDFGFWHGEVLVILMSYVLVSLLVAGFIGLRRQTLQPAVFAILVTSYIAIEFGLYLPAGVRDWAADLGGVGLAYGIDKLVYVAALLILFAVLRRHINVILLITFGSVLASTVAFPKDPVERQVVSRDLPAAAKSDAPPVLHVILDQQIGIEGLPLEIPGAAELKEELKEFYAAFGFTLFSRAYTHFPATAESIPNLLNGATVPDARRVLNRTGEVAYLEENRWFRFLSEAGYDIQVFQSRFLDYCRAKETRVTYCFTYNESDARLFRDLPYDSFDKARLVFAYFLESDLVPFLRFFQVVHQGLQDIAERLGLTLPDWTFRSYWPVSIATLEAMPVIAKKMESMNKGAAYFMHLLLPHGPFIYERDCRLKPRLADWARRNDALWWRGVRNDPQRRQQRYQAYFEQVRCAHAQLRRIFDIMKRSGTFDSATVIVHGDHGSLISLTEPYGDFVQDLSDRDMVDTYSTLLAIKKQGLAPGENSDQRSTQGLFAEYAMGRGDVEHHDDVFLRSRQGMVEAGQDRRPMVPIGPD